MVHKDKKTQQYRVWLKPETVKLMKLFALLNDTPDWNIALDDCALAGVVYLNELNKLEMAEWSPSLTIPTLKQIRLQLTEGPYLPPEER